MVCAALSGRQGQERRAARRASTRAGAHDAGTSGKRLDAPCRPESVALRVAPRRPPAASRGHARKRAMRASTVVPATLFGPLLADRSPGRDAGRDHGEKCGLAIPCPCLRYGAGAASGRGRGCPGSRPSGSPIGGRSSATAAARRRPPGPDSSCPRSGRHRGSPLPRPPCCRPCRRSGPGIRGVCR